MSSGCNVCFSCQCLHINDLLILGSKIRALNDKISIKFMFPLEWDGGSGQYSLRLEATLLSSQDPISWFITGFGCRYSSGLALVLYSCSLRSGLVLVCFQ